MFFKFFSEIMRHRRLIAVILAVFLLAGLPAVSLASDSDGESSEIIEEKAEVLSASAPSQSSGSGEDTNYIVVEKRFIGLPPELIPDSFRISVSSDTSTYTLDRSNTSEMSETSDGDVIWRWKLTGVGNGTYRVSESGEAAENYNVTKSGDGIVEVRAADIKVSVPVHETTCSHTDWPVRVDGDSNVMFAATLTQGGVAVISKYPLSASHRAAVAATLLKINGPWKTPVYFYSVEEQIQNRKGFELNGATITYDSASEEVIIGKTKNWQHVATVSYSISEASNPEIGLINTYSRALTDVTVEKSVEGGLGDREKSFDFSASVVLNGTDAGFSLDGTAHTGSARFSLKHGEAVVLRDVPLGAEVTVREDDYESGGYTAAYSVNGQSPTDGKIAVIDKAQAAGNNILFINTKNAFPDTGVTTDTLPYLILLGITAGTALIASWRQIREKRHKS